MTVARAALAAGRGTGRSPGVLPAWPMQVLLFGFPVWWALGAAPFALVVIAGIMMLLMAVSGRLLFLPGVLPWFVFLAWVFASAVSLTGALQAVGYLQRVADLVAVGIFMVYYVNARERVSARMLLSGLMFVWGTIVVLGLLAIQFPNFRLTTPVGLLLPSELTGNDLVFELVFPRLAEVQQPFGAEVPFNRPAAPFPFTNSWGVAFVLLTPVALAYLTLTRSRVIRIVVGALLALSVWPALETSNRGMFLGLAVAIGYVVVRSLFRGRWVFAGSLVAIAATGAAALFLSGALAQILARQDVSDSTGTRSQVYAETFRATLESPLLGLATPSDDPTIGIALGTQGQVWTLMYSYGFVGLGLFVYFLISAIARTRSPAGISGLWLHAVPVAAAFMMFFYGLGGMQLTVMALVLAVLLRARYFHESLR